VDVPGFDCDREVAIWCTFVARAIVGKRLHVAERTARSENQFLDPTLSVDGDRTTANQREA
jgi:hypothetical protein